MARPDSFFKTILAAAGNPHMVEGPVATAAHLARRQRARLHIVHAVPLIDALGKTGPKSAGNERGTCDDSYAMARCLLGLYTGPFPQLLADDVEITTGVAWEAIYRAASELRCDLIVVGPHKATAPVRSSDGIKGFLGSTADGVIRRAGCPVMIVKDELPGDLLGFQRIMVGMDFSASCTAAVCLAALLAHRYGSFVSTFHMLPIAPYPKYTPRALQADRIRQQKRMNIVCSRLLEGTTHQLFLKPGVRPHEELLRFADLNNADVIILGSHTRERAGKWYSGSVVQQVAARAACPLVVVNGPAALTPWKDVPFVSRCFPAPPPSPDFPR